MNFYEVGYTTWEECPQIILSHDEVYTQDEFNEILLDAYVEVSKMEEVQHNEWYNEWLLSDDSKEDREIFGYDYYKYISYNIHDGYEPSRRDDLISLGYLYLDIIMIL